MPIICFIAFKKIAPGRCYVSLHVKFITRLWLEAFTVLYCSTSCLFLRHTCLDVMLKCHTVMWFFLYMFTANNKCHCKLEQIAIPFIIFGVSSSVGGALHRRQTLRHSLIHRPWKEEENTLLIWQLSTEFLTT